MKKKTIVFLLLTICTVMIPAQVDTFEVKTDIRWERDLLRIRVENALNPEIFVIQEAILQAEREIEKAFPRILRMALEPIVVNSKETVKDLISTDLTYLNVIESLSQNAFQENFYLSENLDVLISEYNVHLYSDFTKIFVTHDTPIPIRPHLGYIAADDYSAVVIVATGLLPVFGKSEAAALQPALLDGCFDSLAAWEQGPPWLSAMLWAMSARVTLSRYWLMTSSSPAQNGRVAHWPDNGHSLISLSRQGMGATLPSIAAMISPAVVWAGSFTRR